MQSLAQITTHLLTNLEEKFLPKRRVTEKRLSIKNSRKVRLHLGVFTAALYNGVALSAPNTKHDGNKEGVAAPNNGHVDSLARDRIFL
jgi:hypothetical protein